MTVTLQTSSPKYLRFDMYGDSVHRLILIVDGHALQARFDCTDSHDFGRATPILTSWCIFYPEILCTVRRLLAMRCEDGVRFSQHRTDVNNANADMATPEAPISDRAKGGNMPIKP